MIKPLDNSIATHLRLQADYLKQSREQAAMHGQSQLSHQQQEGPQNDPGQQQQQQQADPAQQQQNEPPDPFAGMDIQLLDDQTRQAVEKARGEIRTLHGRAQSASQLQSERDRLTHQVTQYQQHLQQLQRGQPQNQPDPNREPTLEDELREVLIANNMPAENAAITAKVQAAMMEKLVPRIENRMGRNLSPVINNVVNSNARDAFDQVLQMDTAGLFSQNDEVKQALWDRLDQGAKNGEILTPEVAFNLASIYYIQHLQKGGQPSPNMHQQQQQQQPPPIPNGSTRLTYPGAGIHAQRPPTTPSNNIPITADLQAAMGATVGNWDIKPKAFGGGRGDGGNAKVVVTRNGR